MHPDLDRLVRAQDIDRVLYETRGRLERLTPRRQAAEESVAAARRTLAGAEERVKAVALARRTAEKDVETFGEQERKFQTQLTQVKKNEEYTALLHEIEGAKKKRSERETAVLESMDEEARAAAAVTAAKAALATAEKAAETDRSAIAAEEAVVRGEEQALLARRDAVLADLPSGLRARYDRLLGAKRGVAVAVLEKDACAACGSHLPPQKAIAVRRGEGVVECPDCGRILVPVPV